MQWQYAGQKVLCQGDFHICSSSDANMYFRVVTTCKF